jgi:hypothetical protein
VGERQNQRLSWFLVVLCALGLGLAAFVVFAERPGAVGRPSPQVQRLLPKVARYLEVKQGGGTRRTADGWWVFCGVRYLGNSPVQTRFDLYVWEACQEYRAQGTRLRQFTGWSLPAVISVARTASGYRPVGERQPGDGDYYAPDIHRMFPSSAEKAIWKLADGTGTGPGTVSALFADLRRRARRELLVTG